MNRRVVAVVAAWRVADHEDPRLIRSAGRTTHWMRIVEAGHSPRSIVNVSPMNATELSSDRLDETKNKVGRLVKGIVDRPTDPDTVLRPDCQSVARNGVRPRLEADECPARKAATHIWPSEQDEST